MSELQKIISDQQIYFQSGTTKGLTFRKEQLKKLKSQISRFEEQFCSSVYEDFKKPHFETFETEIGLLYSEIDFTLRNLEQWTSKRTVETNLANLPARSYIQAEPFGVSLIIGAWNYPFLLTLHPLISAIAAGNTAIVKPSEVAIKSSEAVSDLIQSTFPKEYVFCAQGDHSVAQELLAQRFDKIFFTGGPAVGKIVYKAAAEHLTPVTLELGGKSPAFILPDANWKTTPKKLVWGKFINAGQTCVAPDYLLVHERDAPKLLEGLKMQIEKIHGPNPAESEAFSRIVNDRHFERVSKLIDKSKVYCGGQIDAEKRYIAPTVLYPATWEDACMQEEIFGPVLPVMPYSDFDSAIDEVKKRPKPLALYVFSKGRKARKKIMDQLSFGAAIQNDTLVHFANVHLPLGGVGDSGIGNYHGKYGFDAFSYYKSVMLRPSWPEPNIKYPPYTNWKQRLLRKLI